MSESTSTMVSGLDGDVGRSGGVAESGFLKVAARNLHEGASDARMLLLPKVPPCRHCGTYKFHKEMSLFCYLGGDISLAESVLPDVLVDLVTGTDTRSKEFHNMIRTYNNHFSFMTIGIRCDPALEHRYRGVYTVRVQGKVYHFIGDFLPQDGTSRLSGLQLYFYDTDHQVRNRMELLPRLDVKVVDC